MSENPLNTTLAVRAGFTGNGEMFSIQKIYQPAAGFLTTPNALKQLKSTRLFMLGQQLRPSRTG